MNASTGFGMSWPAGADPYAGEDELSFGSAFSTVAALAETPLVPDVSTLPSEGAMMMNPSADYHADQSYPSAPPREQPEPLE